jgi:hypothetical protein
MTVDTAVREQSHEVQRVALRRAHGVEQHWIFEEGSVLDALINADDVLIHDAARTDVEMAHFAVAHLPHGQPDPLLRRLISVRG